MRRSHGRGFTLIEVMIVVAIVALIAAFALPQYTQYVLKSRRSDAKSAVLDLAAREERFFTVNNAYTNSAANLGYGAGSTFPINISPNGQTYYTMNVSVTAGSSTTLPAFVVTATPVASTNQVKDSCYAFRVDQTGLQTNLSSGGSTISSAGCW